MRRVLLGDLVAAAQVLAAAPEMGRASLARLLVHQADAAHRYMVRHGRPHPQWGTGTLESRARAADGPPLPPFDLGDRQVLSALHALADALSCRIPAPYARLQPDKGGNHGQFKNQTRQH